MDALVFRLDFTDQQGWLLKTLDDIILLGASVARFLLFMNQLNDF